VRYADFERIMSASRMARYIASCGGDSKKAMTLYRYNLRLSQELFTIISCFEVSLRNAIDQHYTTLHGNNWLRDAANTGGIFDNNQCRVTAGFIRSALNIFGLHYTHAKLVAKMDFGFWRYMFAQPQYRAGGQTLLQIYPAKPTSTATIQYNQSFIFNELAKVNDIRNRIAHHEPICFQPGHPIINTTYARQHYALILQLFQWMSINESALLYGLDHINTVCDQIDHL